MSKRKQYEDPVREAAWKIVEYYHPLSGISGAHNAAKVEAIIRAAIRERETAITIINAYYTEHKWPCWKSPNATRLIGDEPTQCTCGLDAARKELGL